MFWPIHPRLVKAIQRKLKNRSGLSRKAVESSLFVLSKSLTLVQTIESRLNP
jgi:hypothetical protein